MLINPPPVVFRKPSRRRKGKKAPPEPPPPVGNMIVLVEHGVEPSEIVVTLNSPVTSYDDVDKMLGVSVEGGEDWFYPQAINVLAPERVRFAFDGDVSATLFWRVPGPSNWHFLDGELGEPWVGEIS